MVFTGTELLFFILGVLFTIAFYTMIRYNQKYKFRAFTWFILSIGILLFIFGFAWAVSSFLEGVPRAASMGIVFFCVPALIIILIGRRMALKSN